MKHLPIIIISLFMSCMSAYSQVHKLNMGLDLSYGTHYYNSNINNPLAVNISVGYEYMLCKYFGLEAGVSGGGFSQSIRMSNNELEQIKDIYKGNTFSLFIVPKLYYHLGTETSEMGQNYLFIEGKLKQSYTQLNKSNAIANNGKTSKPHFTYEVKAGYSHPIDTRWNLSFWVGYNYFDFAVVEPNVVDFKSSTPLQLGVGFSYLFSRKR